jgi:DNA/RNA-binding protein KIN17
MPKAEVGSTKWVGNKMKAKGLQRLRWYCQICEKQCRDDNGFKQHTMSEGHVRAMLLVGEDPKKFINDYSRQFQRDFLQLLKVAHGEKKVHMNNFYQQYISDKEHIHMNSTKWPSLTEFAKHLGREGLCRVEEGERGVEIAFIDDSAAAIQRKEEIKKQMQSGDGDVEARLLQQQIRKAKEAEKERAGKAAAAVHQQTSNNDRDGVQAAIDERPAEPFKMSFGLKNKSSTAPIEYKNEAETSEIAVPITVFSTNDNAQATAQGPNPETASNPPAPSTTETTEASTDKPAGPPKMSFSLAAKKDKAASNPLSSKASKNPFKQKTATTMDVRQKPMSNAERIMKQEMERERLAEERGGKRRRLA